MAAERPGRLRLHEAYRRLFCSPEGELVMEDLARRGFMDRTTVAVSGGGVDPVRSAYNEGRRSLVLYVRHMTDAHHFRNMEEDDA